MTTGRTATSMGLDEGDGRRGRDRADGGSDGGSDDIGQGVLSYARSMPSTSDRPASPRPTAVVFDLGGVLIDWNPRYLYRQLFSGDDAAMETFLADITTQDWNLQQDAGRPWAEAVESLSKQHPEQAELIAAYRDRWAETLGEAVQPTVQVLDDLRRSGVRLFALSNWSAETFPVARPRYPFLEWFEGIVISGEVGITKPDLRLYRHLLDRYGLDPTTTVFIDDNEANILAAEELGMIAIRFEDGPSVRRALAGLGLLDHVSAAGGASADGAAAN
jgi:2-haloacid dehalogenase